MIIWDSGKISGGSGTAVVSCTYRHVLFQDKKTAQGFRENALKRERLVTAYKPDWTFDRGVFANIVAELGNRNDNRDTGRCDDADRESVLEHMIYNITK